MLISNKKHFYLILAVFIPVILLRFLDLGSFSMSNDELSAIVRLEVSSFTELIHFGVIETEPHPAGVQVFLYYWTKIFGLSPFMVRLPFVLFGLLSLVLLYKLFKDWFGEQAALMATGFYALLEFVIIHSQLARPYAMGIFASSLFIYAWNYFLQKDSVKTWVKITYVVAAALCAYIHYFAALMAFIVAVAGVFDAIKLKKIKTYVYLNLAAFILFLPHIYITLQQLKRDTITAWIPEAEYDFLWNHAFSVLNESWLLTGIFGIGFLFSIWKLMHVNPKKRKFFYLSLIFFLTPIFVGYLYAAFFGPALMDRVLFFSSPFLIVLPFAMISDLSHRSMRWLFSIVMIICLYSTLIEKDFLDHRYTENFKDLTLLNCELHVSSQGDIMHIGNFNSIDYMYFYPCDEQVKFEMDRLDHDEDLVEFMQKVRNSEKNHLLLSWACMYQPIEAVEYTKMFYSISKRSSNYYNSGYWYFDKNPISRDTLFYREYGSKVLDEINTLTSAPIFSIDAKNEFAEIYNDTKSNFEGIEVFNAYSRFKGEVPDGLLLVIDISDQDGNNILWKGKKLKDFETENDFSEIIMSCKLPEDLKGTDRLKIYFWNANKQDFKIDYVTLSSFSDSHYPLLY